MEVSANISVIENVNKHFVRVVVYLFEYIRNKETIKGKQILRCYKSAFGKVAQFLVFLNNIAFLLMPNKTIVLIM